MNKLKDSGIPWIGLIPEHWKVINLKKILKFQKGTIPKKFSDKELDIPYLTMDYLRNKEGYQTIYPVPDSSLTIVEDSELIVLWDGANAGEFLISKFGYLGSTMAKVFAEKKIFYTLYLYYFLKALEPISKFFANGTTIPHFSPFFLFSYNYPVAPLEEQERIAEWLDGKCGEIDELIELEQQMIADLETYRQAVITEAVTHGLNSDAPTKPTSNPWIGNIPEHWETIPVQHFFEFRNGYTPSKSETSFWINGSIPWYRMEDIRKSGRKLNESIQYITPEAVKNGGMFEAGSYILATCTASIGEHAMLITDSLANQRFTNLKIRKSLIGSVDGQYIFYYMFILGKFCRETAIVTTFPYADITLVRNFSVTQPPYAEQMEIAEYLDSKCAEIDEAIKIKQEKIETLKQYRQSLIYEAVTGKILITNIV